MLTDEDLRPLRDILPNLRAMKKSTQECIKKLEELENKR
jgi:hypothetical protein